MSPESQVHFNTYPENNVIICDTFLKATSSIAFAKSHVPGHFIYLLYLVGVLYPDGKRTSYNGQLFQLLKKWI